MVHCVEWEGPGDAVDQAVLRVGAKLKDEEAEDDLRRRPLTLTVSAPGYLDGSFTLVPPTC